MEFQSTFPRGERRNAPNIGYDQDYNFNPRSRVGNDLIPSLLNALSGISIHVPAWGTTTKLTDHITRSDISIHVPAWGTTWGSFEIDGGKVDFNPRSRVGNDDMTENALVFVIISIHVPAWGTTEP